MRRALDSFFFMALCARANTATMSLAWRYRCINVYYMVNKLKKLLSLITFVFCLVASHLQAQTLEGRVLLGDSVPAAYATIYVPATGIGTVTDSDGHYLIDVPRGKVEVEFAYLGYRTEKHQIVVEESRPYIHDESLEEQPLNLNDVYVTPTGEDPAIYILRKVAEQAKTNSKRLKHYEAQKEYVFHSQDADFLPAVLPKAIMWTLNALMKSVHRGAIWDHCISHEQTDARLTAQMICNDGLISYKNEKLISATPAMSDKAREQLFKTAHEDPFEKLYGNDTDYCSKMLKKGKCKYRLKGTIEENGLVIDVLVNEQAGDKDDPAVSTLYVIEDNWCILRSEVVSETTRELTECRNVGNGVYLPVSYLNEPTFASLDLEKMIEKHKAEVAEKKQKGEKVSSSESKFLQRVERYASTHSTFKPSIANSYRISYSKVQLK